MLIILDDLKQGSDEWFQARMGRITASRAKDVLTGGQGKTRASYMRELAAEICTGEPQDSYSNCHMEHGINTEQQAIDMWKLNNPSIEDDMHKVGFCFLDDMMVGYSPDALIGTDGALEIKCPKTTTQIETFCNLKKMPTVHTGQIQMGMWISERDWCDFVSFDPRINGVGSYFCERQYRDEKYIKKLIQECDIFLDQLNDLIYHITNGHPKEKQNA